MRKKLTPSVLKAMVLEEKKKLEKSSMGKTVEKAWAGGKNLEKQIVWAKALKLEEAKLKRKIKEVALAKRKLKIKILKELG